MNNSVSLYEAKTQLSTLLREVEGGAVITITRHGKPVAELRGLAAERPRARAGSLKSPGFYMADDFDAPLPEFAEYMSTTEEAALRVAEEPATRQAKPRR
ncbi:MAG: type II toxin-antitoxin system prevent-host-death family antitoxin [Chthoniobacter sp.]|nr:type II toxin-antitoxin system prevent-host-death family antitoxin [Chthoniobacter sp.]